MVVKVPVPGSEGISDTYDFRLVQSVDGERIDVYLKAFRRQADGAPSVLAPHWYERSKESSNLEHVTVPQSVKDEVIRRINAGVRFQEPEHS
jgi:hypothetical protein